MSEEAAWSDWVLEKNSLLNKSALYFVGNFASRFISVFFIPIYAFFVTTEELGYFDYYQTVTNIIVPIAYLAIWEAILKLVIRENDKNIKRKVIATANTFIIFILIITALLTVAIDALTTSIQSIYLIATMIGIHSITQIWQYYARALSENKLFVLSGIYSSLGYLLSTIVFIVVLKTGLNGLFLSYIISQLIIFIVIESKIRLIKLYSIRDFDSSILLKMLAFSTPLVVNLISLWLITGANRLIITNMLGAEANGLYSFASRFSIIISMFGTIISMALIEEAYLYKDVTKYAKSFSIIIQKIFRIYFSILMITVPLLRLLYEFIEGSEFYNSANYIFLLLLAALFSAIANNFGSAFQVTNKTQYIFYTTLIGAVVSIGGSLLTLSYIGIYGVLIAQLVGMICMAISRAIFAYKLTGLNIKWKIVIILFSYVVLLGLIGVFYNLILLSVVLLINIFIVVIMNKRDIINVYQYARSFITSTKN